MKRRTVIKNTIFGVGGLSLLSSFKAIEEMVHPFGKTNIGVQLFTIPGLVDQDLRGTLKTLNDIGYTEVEFFGPYPFSAEVAIKQWEEMKGMLQLKNNAFYGYTAKETSQLLKEHNLMAPSMHTDIVSLRTNLGPLLEGLAPINPKYVVIPALLDSNERKDAGDYRKLADEFNRFGEQMNKYGMKFVYHNHGYEHATYNGETGLDILLKNTDADYVQFELDIFWMKAAGAEPVQYLKRYPGRFKLLHIKDAAAEFRFSGDGGTPDQWMEGFPKMADPGDGIFDIKKIIAEGSKSGVDHFFLERDLAPNPMETLNNSFKNLNAMF
ncbi:sugar phosphate isomerase/epimerase family protein [Ulvibacterium sp.]|uniref:sugar phosphate isomerase/epimerase family protein n=1 Tax=Ulvibacterium sp. TaxID=2665914 RepID=UPI003BAA3297